MAIRASVHDTGDVTVVGLAAHELLAEHPQRPLQHCPLIGGQDSRQAERAIVAEAEVDPPGLLGPRFGRRFSVGVDRRLDEGIAAERASELGHRGRPGQLGHLAVVVRWGVTTDHRHLVLGQLSSPESGPGLGKVRQPTSHGHQRPGPPEGDTAFPRHPLLRRANPGPGVRLGGQHPPDERHEPPRRHIENAAHLGDLVLENSRLGFAALGSGVHTVILDELVFDTQVVTRETGVYFWVRWIACTAS